MTKKNFIAMAKLFRARIEAEREAGNNMAGLEAIFKVIEDFCTLAKADNSAFERARFLNACGL